MQQTGNAGTPLISGRVEDEICVHWIPIYVEPIPYSGERLTALIGFCPEDGEPRVLNTLLEASVKSLYGDDAKAVITMGQYLQTDLKAWLEAGGGLDQWEPPLSGVYLGDVQTSYDTSLENVIKQAVTSTSSLSVKALSLDTLPSFTGQTANKWQEQVKRSVVQRRESLAKNFDRPFTPWDGSRGFRVGYAGNRLMMQFGVINPSTAHFNEQMNRAMRRIMELRSLQNHMSDWQGTDLRLALWTPDEQELTIKQRKTLDSSVIDMEHMSDDLSIRLERYTAADSVRDLILQDAA